MSFEECAEVSPPKSARSHRATASPRRAASRATAAPVAPPPTTRTSKVSSARRPSAFARATAIYPPVGLLSRSELEGDVQLIQLPLGHGSGSIGAQVGPLLGLGEGDHVTQGLGAAQEHGQPIDAGRDPPMGR